MSVATSLTSLESILHNPLDLAEQLVIDRDLLCDRFDDGELIAEATGDWCHYRLWFTWQPDLGGLSFSCAYDTHIPERARARIFPLLAAINERIWLGHFALSEEGTVMFRHAMLLCGQQVTAEQLSDLLDIAIAECNRFYPAFQSVLWGGASAEEALQIAIIDVMGEA